MKLSTKLFVAAGLVGAGIFVERARQQRLLARAQADAGPAMGADVIIEAEIIGITEVELEPMIGIDPGAPVPPRFR